MKSFIALISVTVGILAVQNKALACAPPLPTYDQEKNLSLVLQSEEYRQAIMEQTRIDQMITILKIDLAQGIQFHLSNSCVIEADVLYRPPQHVGMCPEFDRVETRTICK